MEQCSSKSPGALPVLLICALFVAPGCSMAKRAATNAVADAMADNGAVYASDDDMELVGAAVPFGLKTMEGLLAEVPEHRGLLLAAARGFTQYAYAYVALPADEVEDAAPGRARNLRRRAKRLYLRGRDYGLRALEAAAPGFRDGLSGDPQNALALLNAGHVPALYWAAVSWAAAISADTQDMDLVANLRLIEPMIRRCLDLDESYESGAAHAFMIAFEGGRDETQGGSVARAREHYTRAMEFAGGRTAAPLVALAEHVSVRLHDRREFETLLRRALAFDADRAPRFRLANLVAQRRARFLLSSVDDYFLGGDQ